METKEINPVKYQSLMETCVAEMSEKWEKDAIIRNRALKKTTIPP